MKDYDINTISAVIGAILGAIIGGLDGILIALLLFMCADYITGVLAAIKERRLSSEVGFWGLVKKGLILLLVSVGHWLDVAVFKQGSIIRSGCCMWYISNEGISILENVVRIGLKVPDKLRKILEQLTEDGGLDEFDDKDEIH